MYAAENLRYISIKNARKKTVVYHSVLFLRRRNMLVLSCSRFQQEKMSFTHHGERR